MAGGNDPARETIKGPDVSPERMKEINRLLEGAIDLHCHSGPAAMPRILNHYEAMMECSEAKFQGAGLQGPLLPRHAARDSARDALSEHRREALFPGIALNNALGWHQSARGEPRHQHRRQDRRGCRRCRPPTTSSRSRAPTSRRPPRRCCPPSRSSALDANGKAHRTRPSEVCDLIAGRRHHPRQRPSAGRRASPPLSGGEEARRQEDDDQPPDLHDRLLG